MATDTAYDDFVRHMKEKYKLAVACAIIRTRPPNLTSEEYIEKLQNNLINEQNDIDDVTIISDDFKLSETMSQKSDNSLFSDIHGLQVNGDIVDDEMTDVIECSITDSMHDKMAAAHVMAAAEKKETKHDEIKNILNEYHEKDKANLIDQPKPNIIIQESLAIEDSETNNIPKEIQDLDFTTTQDLEEIHEIPINTQTTRISESVPTLFEVFDLNSDEKFTQNYEIEEIYDSPKNKIPFKIVEELNRVKVFLRRKSRTSSEASTKSGFTNSQKIDSFKSCVPEWLNQAATTLLYFLTSSPVTVTSLDICGEISQVLGELIDKLYWEKSCPTFMDDILEQINVYLDKIHNDIDGNLALKIDETIHRLANLSQSVFIIKHTLNKIREKLEELLPKLTTNSEDIDKTANLENFAYTFHVLEILLQRYIKKKDNIPKRVCVNTKSDSIDISDIWRKKWDPKSEQKVDSIETPCILPDLSETLNKIVVNCMEKYCIIAFSALECYNVIHN